MEALEAPCSEVSWARNRYRRRFGGVSGGGLVGATTPHRIEARSSVSFCLISVVELNTRRAWFPMGFTRIPHTGTCGSSFHRGSARVDQEQYQEHASHRCEDEAVTECVLEGETQGLESFHIA